MTASRIFILTLLAMLAFASNSLLCRAALKQTGIDAATFTFIRIFSGALALWLLMNVRRRITIDRTATPLAAGTKTRVGFPSPSSSSKRRGDPFSPSETLGGGSLAGKSWATGSLLSRFLRTRLPFHLHTSISRPVLALCFCLAQFRQR